MGEESYFFGAAEENPRGGGVYNIIHPRGVCIILFSPALLGRLNGILMGKERKERTKKPEGFFAK